MYKVTIIFSLLFKIVIAASVKPSVFTEDIKQFLGNDVPPATSYQARTALLERVTSALVEFELQSPPPEEDFYDAPQCKDSYENATEASVSPSEGDTSSEFGVTVILPPDAITASAMRTSAIKHGPLYRKERFIFVEQFRRCWAAVNANCLFLFSTDKDSKPMAAFTLTEYMARASPHLVKHCKKKELCFEIVAPGKKTFQFIARTQKDMEQWVAVINSESERRISNGDTDEGCKRIRQLPSPPSSDSEAGDIFPEEDTCVSSESEVYEQMHSDEEVYYNIEDLDISTSQVPPKPTPSPQLVEECQDEYDDVMAYQQKDSYYNVSPTAAEQNQVSPPPPPRATSTPLSPAPPCDEAEDLYDDVGTERQESFHSSPSGWNTNSTITANKQNFASKQCVFNNSPIKIGNLNSSHTKQALPVGKTSFQQKSDINKPTLPSPSTKPSSSNMAQHTSKLSSQMQQIRNINPPLKPTNIKPCLKPVLTSQSSRPAPPTQSSKPIQLSKIPPNVTNSSRKVSSGNIQGLIKLMEASMSGPAKSNSLLPVKDSTEELYEPVEQQDDVTPHLPPRPT